MKTNNELAKMIQTHPFISFERLQRNLGACQGAAMVSLVVELAAMVNAGLVVVSENQNTITKESMANYEWVGAR